MSVAAVIGFMVLMQINGQRLQFERNHALRQEQKATAAAARAEAGELAARERAYAADVYAASQALAVGDLAQARRLLNDHRPTPLTNHSSAPDPSASPAAGHRSDLRGFEWRALWERTRSQESFAFTNLTRPAECLVFAPDGRTLVSGGDDGIHLWDIVEHRPLGLFPGPDPGPTDGDLVMTEDHVRPLLEASPAVVEHLKARPEILDYLNATGRTNRTRGVTSLAFTPDGKHLLVGSRDYVRSWNFATREFDFAVPERKSTLAMPSVGDLFVVANGQPLETEEHSETYNPSAHPRSALIYSFSRRRLVAELPGFGVQASVSPDGQWVAAASMTRGWVLWHPSTEESIPINQEHRSNPLLSFSPDGRLLFVGSDIRQCLWDVPSRRILADLRGRPIIASAVAWSPDGRFLATAGAGRAIAIWPVAGATNDLAPGPPSVLPQTLLRGHEAPVTALVFSPDGRWLISASNDRSVRIWAITEPVSRAAASVPGVALDFPSEIQTDPTTGCVIGRVGGEFTVVDPRHGEAPRALPGTQNHVFAGFLARGRGFITVHMATNGIPSHFEVRSLPDGKVQTRREAFAPPEMVRTNLPSTNFRQTASPDGRWIALAQSVSEHDQCLDLYDLATGRFVTRLPGPPLNRVHCYVRCSPDSRWLVRLEGGDGENQIFIYDSQTWDLPRLIRFSGTDDDLTFAAIDPESRRLATGSVNPNSLRIWDLATGQLVAHCNSRLTSWSPVWSPDGRTLVVRDGEILRFWSMVIFRELAALAEDTHATHLPLGFTQNGRTLVTLTWEGWVRTWTPPTLAEIDLQP